MFQEPIGSCMFTTPYDLQLSQFSFNFNFKPSSFCCACQPGIHSKSGTPGIPGRDGCDGRDGNQGLQGITGPAGPPGLQGTKGETGVQGPSGKKGSAGMGQLVCCLIKTGKNAHGITWMTTKTSVWSRWLITKRFFNIVRSLKFFMWALFFDGYSNCKT